MKKTSSVSDLDTAPSTIVELPRAHLNDSEFLVASRIYNLPTLESWTAAAREWITLLKPGDWIALEGEMGAGKTLAVRSCLRAWNYEEPVPSPTFPLMLVHELEERTIIHIDAFRLSGPEPWDYREWKREIVFVEWSEKTRLPQSRFTHRWKIERLADSEERRLGLEAAGIA